MTHDELGNEEGKVVNATHTDRQSSYTYFWRSWEFSRTFLRHEDRDSSCQDSLGKKMCRLIQRKILSFVQYSIFLYLSQVLRFKLQITWCTIILNILSRE